MEFKILHFVVSRKEAELKNDRAVLFIAPSAYPLGGVAEWLNYVLPGLSVLGWRCHLALVSGGGHQPERYLARNPWGNVSIIENPTGSALGRVLAIQRHVRNSDCCVVVSVNVAAVYDSFRGLRWSGLSETRFVVALHANSTEQLNDISGNADVVDAVFAVNRLLARASASAMERHDRVFYVPCGASLNDRVLPNFHPTASSDLVRLLYVGRLADAEKRVLDLPVLLRLLVDRGIGVELTIVGLGPEENRLRASFQEHRVAGLVNWVGEVPRRSLKSIYRGHSALMIMSPSETGPLVAWEAMSEGLPVISSQFLGLTAESALIDGETALLFPVADLDRAVLCVERLRDFEHMSRIRTKAWEMVRQRYTIDASVNRLSGVLEAVTNLPLRPPVRPSRSHLPKGRLDDVFGVRVAELLRLYFGRSFTHNCPGSAWPHYGSECWANLWTNERLLSLDT